MREYLNASSVQITLRINVGAPDYMTIEIRQGVSGRTPEYQNRLNTPSSIGTRLLSILRTHQRMLTN